MMPRPLRTLEEINRQAVTILLRELGPRDTIRFIRQFTAGFGDYSKDRAVLFDSLTIDQILQEIESSRTEPED